MYNYTEKQIKWLYDNGFQKQDDIYKDCDYSLSLVELLIYRLVKASKSYLLAQQPFIKLLMY